MELHRQLARQLPKLRVVVCEASSETAYCPDAGTLAVQSAGLVMRTEPVPRCGRGVAMSRSVASSGATSLWTLTPEQLAGHDLLVPSGELGALPEARWLSSCKGPRVALR